MILDVAGTVAAIETAFHVNMLYWRHPTRGEFFAADREPSLDTSVPVLEISGLDNFVVPRPMDLQSRPLGTEQPPNTGSGPTGLFDGTDFRNAYAPSVTLTGAGQSVGLLEFDGFYANDVTSNFDEIGLPYVPVTTVLVDGVSGVPGPENVEVTLDIVMASYMAPGLTNVIVYEGGDFNDVLNRMTTDNLASQLSSSWSFGPIGDTTLQIFSEMVAQGQAFFQASGDNGAYTDGIMPPADVPNLTTVGGTMLIMAASGGAWQSETTWSGSGGGVSTFFPTPSYQQTVNAAAAGGSATMRNIPDVAMVSAQIFLFANNGQGLQIGGTSASTPLWAGFMALANQQAAANETPPIGFANPALYAIGAGATYQSDLHDITTGDNGGFNALPGYDLATGWGSPAGQPLINRLTGSAGAQSFGLAASASALAITAGASASSTITISPEYGFARSVILAVSGLPDGVTASFSPAAATTASTLTLTASSAAASSTSTVTITGASGSVTNTAQLALTVTGLPAFTLVTSSSTLSIAQGASGTRTVMIAPRYGFTGVVALAATGLPTGVTASVTPASTTKTTTMKLSAASSATLGTSTVTVTGTSGSLSGTASVNLAITAEPVFEISSSPASLTILQGAKGVSTITIAPQNGFSGAVALTASGLPTGVTASFVKATTTAPGTLTLTAGASATLGTATVTITGTSGTLSSAATVALTVAAPPSFALTASPPSLAVPQGGTCAGTIAIAPLNGFSGAVALSATALPSGVTATFSSLGALSSTVTFSAVPNASTGAAAVTITGRSGSLNAKVTIILTIVPQPIFTLASHPATLSVTPGASGVSSIAITDISGFNGMVALAVSGLPRGITATLGAVKSGSSTLTLTAASTAAAGTSTITITGTSGTLSSKATLALTVNPPPSFTLTAAPAGLSVTPGSSGASSIVITDMSGFTGTVAFSASGLPKGVTATFSAVASGKSAVNFAVASSAATSNSTVTILGTSGSLTETTSIALTVVSGPTSH
jgi:kumamolisin